MSRRIIHTPEAPDPIGPYSQAVFANNTLFISGQIALDPFSGAVVRDNVEDETRQVMANIGAILEAAEMDFSNVAKCSIFLTNMDDFPKVNAVYGSYFKSNPPARETVEVRRLPRNVSVEISAIAIR